METTDLPPMYCLKCFIHQHQKRPMTISGFPQPGLFNASCPVCGWFVINALIEYYPNRPDFKDEPKNKDRSELKLPIDLIDLQYILFGLIQLEKTYQTPDEDGQNMPDAADTIRTLYTKLDTIKKNMRKEGKRNFEFVVQNNQVKENGLT
jgi:hypothetical protein